MVYPFIIKDGNLNKLKTVSSGAFNDFQYGDVITGSAYPYTSSISKDLVYDEQSRSLVRALKNTLNYYINISQHFSYNSDYGDKDTQDIGLVSVPSLFYGSSMRPGSIKCSWYLTGTLIAELEDVNQNGELIQTGPSGSTGSGSVAGIALYREGFLLLTGSWALHPSYTDLFGIGATQYSASWKYFMHTGSDETNRTVSSSFKLDFEGINTIPTMTVLAHASVGEFNHSNNPTYIEHGQTLTVETGSFSFIENRNISIKNMVSSSYSDEEAGYLKTTYISKIALYDEDGNLIGVAKVANPVRKRETDSYTFKLKIDL